MHKWGVHHQELDSGLAGAPYSCRKEQFPHAAATKAVPSCTALCHSGSPLLPVPETGLGELEWAGENPACSRLSVVPLQRFYLFMDLFCQVQPSSHPPACWVRSHQDRHTGTTQCPPKAQRCLWCVLQHHHLPMGLERQLAIKLDLKSHKNIVGNTFTLFISPRKNSACTEHKEAGGPQAAAVLSILPCLGTRPVPVPAAGGEGAQQGCAACAAVRGSSPGAKPL